MAATQLSSIHARRVFPCFDEPDLKATFNVTVLRKQPFISLGNTNLLRTENRWAEVMAEIVDIAGVGNDGLNWGDGQWRRGLDYGSSVEFSMQQLVNRRSSANADGPLVYRVNQSTNQSIDRSIICHGAPHPQRLRVMALYKCAYDMIKIWLWHPTFRGASQ